MDQQQLSKKKKPHRKAQLEEMGDDEDEMEIEDIDFTKSFHPKDLKDSATNDMDEEKEQEGDEILDVEFVFYDSDPNQFFSVKNLINGLLDGMSYKSSQLADLITKQGMVGTMIGCEDEDENPKERNIFSLATILNLGLYQVI